MKKRATGIVRQVDGLGRIVIPIEIRKNYGISNNDSMEIYTDDNGCIILQKYQRGCISCGEMEAYTVNGLVLCKECIDKIAAAIGEIDCATTSG